MKVLKFGGTSVRDAPRIERVAELVAQAALETADRPPVVVVSALGGVTDKLVTAAGRASQDLHGANLLAEELHQRHLLTLEQLAQPADRDELIGRVDRAFSDLRQVLQGISLIGECSPRTSDKVLSLGERLSAQLVAAALRSRGQEAQACDARELLCTDSNFGAAHLDLEATIERVREYFEGTSGVRVVTGFIASNGDGATTTLGRGGSDLTAAVLGAALGAEVVEIWTDVDGVMSADPRLVPDAFSIPRLSYEELLELSHFGAKVVFPPTIQPTRRAGIPLAIKNTLHPEFEGTWVAERIEGEKRGPITGVASINHVALLRLEGDGMVGVPGTAARLFEALARVDVNVILISQASSEHSICFAVDPDDAAKAQRAVAKEFTLEQAAGLINDLVVEGNQSIVAIVGEGMRDRPGIADRLFRLLARRGINVRAIAQGSSELNISLVMQRQDEERALRAIHDSFFRPDSTGLDIVVAGVGGVGSELLRQVLEQAPTLSDRWPTQLRLTGVLDSTLMLLDSGGLSPAGTSTDDWKALLRERGQPHDLEELVRHLKHGSTMSVLVDCTASDRLGELYPVLLEKGVSVVSANKLPFAGDSDSYRQLQSARRPFGRGLYYEATVGAGLPVLRTAHSLFDTDDRPVRIEGAFSGTLSFLLGELNRGVPFSSAVRDAYDRGYTEPDPREDLSGQDVARKLLILARECGYELEPDDIRVEPLITEPELLEGSVEHFLANLELADERFASLLSEAETLTYLARFEPERAQVGLQAVANDHPCASIVGTDNVFSFVTTNYSAQPLVIRGPGAGTAVTAGGVFADILRVLREAVPEPLPLIRNHEELEP